MEVLDFSYDKRLLSSFGFIICHFDGAIGKETLDAGSQITFNTVPQHGGSRVCLTGSKYETCIQSTFHICKNPCECGDDMEITSYEYRDIVRWLNRKRFLPFCFYSESQDIETIWYDASFNIKKLISDGKVYALELTMTTNSPFGYGTPIVLTLECDSAPQNYTVRHVSDEIGHTYPDLEITCKQDGDLQIINHTMECSLVVRNCIRGEVINIDGMNQIISSSSPTHKIYNDFNFVFLKIGNTYRNNANKIEISQPCTIKMTYRPIIKDLMM